jgi:hypothetical protein
MYLYRTGNTAGRVLVTGSGGLLVSESEYRLKPAAGYAVLVFRGAGYLAGEYTLMDGVTDAAIKLVAPQYGIEPTLENTGPRTTTLTNMTPEEALNSYGTIVRNKRITGTLAFSAPGYWKHIGPDPRGQMYTFIDCEILGGVSVITAADHESGRGTLTPEADMVDLNMSYCKVAGGMHTAAGFKGIIDHCSFGSKTVWATGDVYNPGAVAKGATYNIYQNCYFWAEYKTQPSHWEVAQSFSKVNGLTLYNCTLEQEGGPLTNSGVTAIVNLALAPDNVFDHCFFLWDGSVPAYYAIYSGGSGTYRNCYIEDGAGYLYPGSGATFTNCRSYTTNNLLTLP